VVLEITFLDDPPAVCVNVHDSLLPRNAKQGIEFQRPVPEDLASTIRSMLHVRCSGLGIDPQKMQVKYEDDVPQQNDCITCGGRAIMLIARKCGYFHYLAPVIPWWEDEQALLEMSGGARYFLGTLGNHSEEEQQALMTALESFATKCARCVRKYACVYDRKGEKTKHTRIYTHTHAHTHTAMHASLNTRLVVGLVVVVVTVVTVVAATTATRVVGSVVVVVVVMAVTATRVVLVLLVGLVVVVVVAVTATRVVALVVVVVVTVVTVVAVVVVLVVVVTVVVTVVAATAATRVVGLMMKII
jgi:hypothetical protein